MIRVSGMDGTEARAHYGSWGGVATFSGAVVTVAQAPSVVATLLPPALRLVDATWAERSAEEHPIVCVFGEMTAGGVHWGGRDLPSGMRYREASVFVPFVGHADSPGPMVFSCEMLADHVAPVVLGNYFYGLRKRVAFIDWEGAGYRAYVAGQPVIECTGALPDVRPANLNSGDLGLRWLKQTFALPILGLRGAGQYIQSNFIWDLNGA